MNGELRKGSHLEMSWRSIAPAGLSKHQHPQLAVRWTLGALRYWKPGAGANENELQKCISCYD
jgi:hypothetical protein